MGLSCLIVFENAKSESYWAGQVVSGTVTITADKLEQFKAVSLKIKGCAFTQWNEKSMDDSTDSYSAYIEYMKIKTYLFELSKDSNDANKQVNIEPGSYRFPFTCCIPPECPSSVEGRNGYIRYWVQVTFNRPRKFDKNFKKIFNVLHVQDLNLNADLKLPIESVIEKQFCCGPCKSDLLAIDVHLPQNGYVPGQLIPINILVTNNTMSHINKICFRLVMIMTCYSNSLRRSQREEKIVSKLIGDPVSRSCKKNFSYLLPIPATPPTCLTQCSIIEIYYRLDVEVKIRGFLYPNVWFRTPLTIGNVPLRMPDMVVLNQPAKQLHFENIEKSAGTADYSCAASTSNENKEPWTVLGNISPPVYKEATHMSEGKLAENTAHEYGDTQFTPKYPVFDVDGSVSRSPTNADAADGHAVLSAPTDPDKTTWL